MFLNIAISKTLYDPTVGLVYSQSYAHVSMMSTMNRPQGTYDCQCGPMPNVTLKLDSKYQN